MLLTVRFGTESAMLAALAVAGAEAGAGPAARIGLAVLGPVLAAAVWGLLIAPAARRRLPDPGRFLVEIVLFLTAAAALTATDHAAVAAAFAVVAIGSAILVRAFATGS